MVEIVRKIGGRKLALGLIYLIGCFVIAILAVTRGASGWDALGIASLPTSIATGLGVIVWGNVQEHRAKNGVK
jgi:hypothetical protein